MKFVSAGVLNVAYHEVGPADGLATILLHGFPYDAHAFDEVAELLADSGHRCISRLRADAISGQQHHEVGPAGGCCGGPDCVDG